MSKNSKIQTCFRISRDNRQWLVDESMATGRSQAELIGAALEQYRIRDSLILAVKAAIHEELRASR